jgi:hypothetical protein
MPSAAGRSIPLSLPRRFIGDLVAFARRVPTVPVERRMRVGPISRARLAAANRVSWCAIFVKAYAVVAASMPELRRAYLSWPWPRLYEHSDSVASVAVERSYRGEPSVFFGHIRGPENQTLTAIDAHLRRYKDEPIEQLGIFRRALIVSRLPLPLRRWLWWVSLCWSGPMRARRLGTFGVSVYAGLGAASLHPLSPLTTALNYGVISRNGAVNVRLIYDHRVLDGATVARALAALDRTLHTVILDELQGMAATQDRSSGAAVPRESR